MASFKIRGMQDYAIKLSALATSAAEKEVAGRAIYEGAKIVANQIKENLQGNLNDPESVSKKRNVLLKNYYKKPSGALLASFGKICTGTVCHLLFKDLAGWQEISICGRRICCQLEIGV